MKKELISLANYPEYGKVIPAELVDFLSSKDVHFVGAEFAMSAVGAAIWRNDEGSDCGTLLSLYVLPEARLLGVGTFLLESVVEEMVKAHKKRLAFKYVDSGDRSLLTEFFASVGTDTYIEEVPVGRTTIKEAVKVIAEKGEGVNRSGSRASDLDVKDKAAAIKWLNKVSDGRAGEYFGKKPESYFVVRDEKVKSALVISRESENVISLDYAYSENPLDLLGLLKNALSDVAKAYPSDTAIEMLLSTESGQKLFEKLFGETTGTMRVISCSQEIK